MGLLHSARSVESLYEAYVPAVSSAEMATSLETLRLLDRLARMPEVKSILDLGSGISSAVFRRTGKRVVTYDDNEEWLRKTREFLEAQGLPTTGLHLWPPDEEGDVNHEEFDLVFHDLGDKKTREETLLTAINAGKMTILDDMHSSRLLAIVSAVVEVTPELRLLDLREITLDAFGRYAMGVAWQDSTSIPAA